MTINYLYPVKVPTFMTVTGRDPTLIVDNKFNPGAYEDSGVPAFCTTFDGPYSWVRIDLPALQPIRTVYAMGSMQMDSMGDLSGVSIYLSDAIVDGGSGPDHFAHYDA